MVHVYQDLIVVQGSVFHHSTFLVPYVHVVFFLLLALVVVHVLLLVLVVVLLLVLKNNPLTSEHESLNPPKSMYESERYTLNDKNMNKVQLENERTYTDQVSDNPKVNGYGSSPLSS